MTKKKIYVKGGKTKLPDIKSKYTLELDEDQLYSLGGWLKTAAGVGAMFIPGMQGVGAGLLGAGIGDLLTPEQDEEVTQIGETKMPRTVGRVNMTPNVMHFKGGGSLSIAKAKKMLKDGMANGKPLTDKQKRYFGWVAGGSKKELGGYMPDETLLTEWDTMDSMINEDEYKKGGNIYIKPSKRGSLHKHLGVSEDKKIPASKLTIKSTDSPAIRKKKQFAINARKWKHEGGGILEGMDNEQMYGKRNPLMLMEGDTHEDGGIDFMPDVELTDNETVINNVVNSDAFSITKEIAAQYNLPKKAVGKTPAAYTKTIENQFKGRDGDPFAMNTRNRMMSVVSRMSAELAEEYDNEGNQAYFGKVLDKPNYTGMGMGFMNRSNQFKNVYDYWNSPRNSGGIRNPGITDFGGDNWWNQGGKGTAGGGEQPWQMPGINMPNRNSAIQTTSQRTAPTVTTGQAPIYPSTEDDYLRESIKFRNPATSAIGVGMPQFGKDINAGGLRSYSGTLAPEAKGGLGKFARKGLTNLREGYGSGMNNILGLAPIAMSAFNAARAGRDKPEQVNIAPIHAAKINPRLIDPEYQLREVGDVFATGNEAMSQISKKDYLRRRIQSATEEAKAKSGVLGQAAAGNVQIRNRAEEINQANQMRADMFNVEAGLQEGNINAANIGAYQTNRDFQRNVLATMMGEYGRDRGLTAANEKYNERYFNVMENMFPNQALNRDTLQWGATGSPFGVNSGYVFPNSVANNPTQQPMFTPEESQYSGIDLFGNNNAYRSSLYRPISRRGLSSTYMPKLNQ